MRDQGHPEPDRYRDRLHRAGWSLGEYGGANAWTVEARRGELRILATTPSRSQAWRLTWVRASAHGVGAEGLIPATGYLTQWRIAVAKPKRSAAPEDRAAKEFRGLVAALDKQLTLLFTNLDHAPAALVEGSAAAVTKTARVLKTVAADDRQADLAAGLMERAAMLNAVIRSRGKANRQGKTDTL